MFWSTTIIRELTLESGKSYTYVKTIGKITSLCVVRWRGSMLCPGMVCVLCAVQSETLLLKFVPVHLLCVQKFLVSTSGQQFHDKLFLFVIYSVGIQLLNFILGLKQCCVIFSTFS
jgi:hypothetical protein